MAVVKFDNKAEKMNSLGEQVSIETKKIMKEIYSNSAISSVVLISGKPDNFIVGADIRMFDKIHSAQDGEMFSREAQEMMNSFETSQKPMVAAIMGLCLGGGLEVALACHYRIAVNDRKTVLGLPEVMLGLLPGAGGTQRLTQLISPPEALQMMLTGKQVKPKNAKRSGLVDQLVEPLGPGITSAEERTLEYLEEVAIQAAKDLASGKLTPNRKRPLVEKLIRKALQFKYAQDFIFGKAKETVMKMTQGCYPAPLRIIQVVRTGIEKGIVEGYKAEAKGFGELVFTPESKALIGLFHGQTQCKKNAFGKPSKKVEKVGVLGAGLMGAGIVTVSIDKAKHLVVMKDANYEGLQRGESQIMGVLNDKVKKRRMTSFEKDVTLSRVQPTLDYEKFKDCDVVIEAVVEDINVKHRVLADIEAVTRPDCVFATNTSALSIASIAKPAKRPENVIGMHYFSPVDKMPLLEVVTYDKTSKDACAKAVDVGLKQGKVVITVKDSPGFYTTRILAFLVSEVLHLLLEGAKPHDLDKMCKKMGFPVGLVTLLDEVGLDTGAHIQAYLKPIFGNRLSPHDSAAHEHLVSQGFKGRKSGKGIYVYDSKSKSKGLRPINPAAEEILKKFHIPPKRE